MRNGNVREFIAGMRGIAATAACAMLLVFWPDAAFAQSPQPFGACPIEAYQTIQVGGSYGLYTINVGDGTLTLQGSDAELQGTNAQNTNGINGIGFDVVDRFIYGWNPSVRQVVRVGQGGVAEFIGPTPAGLGSFGSNVGDVFNRRLYLLGGTSARVIDLTTNTVVHSFTTSNVGSITDWAFNPGDSQLYTVRNNDGAIVRIDPVTGAGTVVPGVTVPTGASFGAQYFDNQGSLYASRNDGTIFRIRNAAGGGTPSVQVLTTAAPPTNQNDGARCPNSPPPVPSINVRKQLTAESGAVAGRAESNELLTYTFTLTNTGLAVQSGAYSFFEVLPANVTLVSVAGAGIDCPIGSTGARLCTLTHPGPIASNGGTATLTMVVRIADPIPEGVTAITNLATDDNNTPPPGCGASNQPCSPAPVCNPVSDPLHCVVLPLPSADLAITKTNATPFNPGAPDDVANDTVLPGSTTVYTIVVTNLGPDAANGAVVRDQPTAGLTCTTATCGNPQNGASCPSATGPALSAALQSANGIAIPALPGTGAVTFTLTCTVN